MTRKNSQSVSDYHETPHCEWAGSHEEPPLSPQRAFVVQFREEPEGAQNLFTGRVEHMVSGHATRFHSPQELLAFFSQVLSTICAKPP